MLLPKITFNQSFKELIKQIRKVRLEMNICPSASEEISIPKLLNEIIEKEFFKSDYSDITTYFQNHPVSYNKAICAVKIVADSGMFE